MEINKIDNAKRSPFILVVLGAIIPKLFSILFDGILSIWSEPAISWLSNNKELYIAAFVIVFIVYAALEMHRHHPIQVSSSKRSAKLLGLIILLSVPFIVLSANQAGMRTLNFNAILIWMVLMSISAFSSAFIPGIGTSVKSLLIAVPAISLGVAIGTSGAMLGENVIDYGTPFPDATVVVTDHRYDLPSLSGNYPVKALTYVVVRDSNEIRVGIPGIPKEESCRISKYLEVTFDGHAIPPDGEARYFTLEGGKSYTLILK